MSSVLSNNNNKTKGNVGKNLSGGSELLETVADESTKLNAQLTEFHAEFSKFCSSSRESMFLDVMKDGVTFDVLGSLRPYYTRLNDFIMRISNLHEQLEKDKQNKDYSVIQILSEGKKIGSYIEIALNCFRMNIEEISSDTKCVSVLQILGTTLDNLIEVVQNSMYKKESSDLHLYLSDMFDAVKAAVTEPLDTTILINIDSLLTRCLSQNQSSRLKQSAAALWKAVFASSKNLEYSDNLRQALTAVSKKYPIGGFGDGTEFNDKLMKSPFTPKAKTPKAANKKRVMALLNEDSVDYVPIVSSSAKKMKLTEHQKEMFLAQREQLPFMDDDSVQLKGNVLSNIKSQFDVETSIDTISASLPRPGNATTLPADISENQMSGKIDEPISDDTSSSEEIIPVAPAGENTVDVASESKQPAASKKKKRSVAVKLDFDSVNKNNILENDDEISLAELRIREKNKNHMKRVRVINRRTSAKHEVDHGDVVQLLSSSSSSSTDSSSIICLDSSEGGELDQDSTDAPSVKSRRSLAKKAVPKKFNPPAKEVADSKSATSHSEKKQMGRPRKSQLVEKLKSSKSVANEKVKREDEYFSLLNSPGKEDTETALSKSKSNAPSVLQTSIEQSSNDKSQKTVSEETGSETSAGTDEPVKKAKSSVKRRGRRRKSAISAPSELPSASMSADSEMLSESTPPCPAESLNTPENRSPEETTKDVALEKVKLNDGSSQVNTPMKAYSPEDLTTPEKSVSDSLITTPRTSLGRCHTPGILKKFDTPNASERKRMRVHFRNVDGEASLDGVSGSTDASIPVEAVAAASAQRGLPIFKELSECTDSVSKILPKLLPPIQAGATFIRNILEKKKITTIGQIANLDSEAITSLPFRKPRLEIVYAALEEYHKSITGPVLEALSDEAGSDGDITPKVPSDVISNDALEDNIETTETDTCEDLTTDQQDNNVEMISVEATLNNEVVESSQKLWKTVIEPARSHSLSDEIRSINEKLVGLSADLPSSIEIDQLKEVIMNVANTMVSLGSLQRQLLEQVP